MPVLVGSEANWKLYQFTIASYAHPTCKDRVEDVFTNIATKVQQYKVPDLYAWKCDRFVFVNVRQTVET